LNFFLGHFPFSLSISSPPPPKKKPWNTVTI
jgi:hypothetical protein